MTETKQTQGLGLTSANPLFRGFYNLRETFVSFFSSDICFVQQLQSTVHERHVRRKSGDAIFQR